MNSTGSRISTPRQNLLSTLKNEFSQSNFDSWESFLEAQEQQLSNTNDVHQTTYGHATKTLEDLQEQ
jgi:hypothetical protein